VYQDLKNQGYDIFFDYRSISSGAFEQIIISNIKARAHFLLILTPTALDRINEPGDWLRREIETAIEEKRNIIPLLFKGFRFGTPYASEKLTGKLGELGSYNGLNVHEDYFDEAMDRLRAQYLNVPLNTVLHPVSTQVRNVVKEEQVAVDDVLQKNEEVKEIVKQIKESPRKSKNNSIFTRYESEPSINDGTAEKIVASTIHPRLIGGVVGGFLVLAFLIWGGISLFNNTHAASPEPPSDLQPMVLQSTFVPTQTLTPQPIDTLSPAQTLAPAVATLGIGSTQVSNKDNMTLLFVPAGKFIMGSDNGKMDEQPVHPVDLDAYWIDQTEVTNKMYALCATAGVCMAPQTKNSAKVFLYYGNVAFNNFPVIYVNWNMAQTYCGWAGRRLPTEAEWEKAARGTDGRIYPWGNEPPDGTLLNFKGIGQDTSSVKSYEAGKSPYGAYDMLGNVWEWVSDWYGEMYYQNSPTANPKGPDSGTAHVDRGGSWLKEDPAFTVSTRDNSGPDFTSLNLGFRCAMSATP
jgi:formylglycine-generating enzyme required for sulfatase activity